MASPPIGWRFWVVRHLSRYLSGIEIARKQRWATHGRCRGEGRAARRALRRRQVPG